MILEGEWVLGEIGQLAKVVVERESKRVEITATIEARK